MSRYVAIVSALLLFASTSAWSATTSPGKNGVSVNSSGTLLGSGDIPAISGDIQKGKSKRVLQLHGTLNIDGGSNLSSMFLFFFVNGVQVTSGGSVFGQCNPSAVMVGCNLSVSAWVDLDALELANPGTVIGQPITVLMQGGNGAFSGGNAFRATFSANMIKK